MPFIGLYRCPKAIETWDLRLAISASGDGDVERRQKMKQLLKKAAFLLESMTGWWFLYKQPIFGEDSRLTDIFQRGWFNHQLAWCWWRWVRWVVWDRDPGL